MTESEFTLKAMPPRLPRAALERERLQREWERFHDRAAIVIAAPAGFGKTTLMLQWRRRWMAEGALVAWLDADDQDEPERFTMALLYSLHTASGRSVDPAAQCTLVPGVEVLTRLLSSVAVRGTQTVLMIDDAERLPEASVRTMLQYLLMNAPANLHVVIGSRVPLPLQSAELTAKGNYAALSAADLRLRLEESMEMIERRMGERLDADDRAHLHEVTEGWPIGLQLAIATIEQEADPAAAVRALSARHGTLQDYFVETLLSRMPEQMARFLVRASILDPLNAAMCEAVTGDAQAGDYLDWLARETPIVMVGERSDCVRLHPMARDFLLGRFEQRLPREERDALHMKAARWLAGAERYHEAANHALAAGDKANAEAWAAKSLWALSTGGQLAEAREWLERLPHEMLEGDAQLRLVAASILALSDRNAEAQRFARTVLEEPATTGRTLAMALRIAAGSAAYADQLDQIPPLLPRWPTREAAISPLYSVTGLNVRALLALHAGDTAQARAYLAEAAGYGDVGSLRLAAGIGRMLLGLSHLWDGDANEAEAVLRPALARAEREDGRRSLRASLLAAVLAEALVQGDQPEAAQGLLANRIDVLERNGFADTLLCAYRTLASIALGQGDERRALGVLDDLCVLADRRQLPRLRVHALAEQVRIHALHGRAETIARLVEALDAMESTFGEPQLRWFQPQYQLTVAIARAYASLARHDFDEAEQQLAMADALARQQRRGHDMLTTKMLRAVVARERDADQALPLLAETLSLAQLSGNARLLANAPPAASALADELHASGTRAALRLVPVSAPPTQPGQAARAARPASVRHALLTSKEAEILQLLQKGMTNKEIARALDVSGETVKWHLKNLFLKLSAGTRKHAVDRARLLGIVQ